MSEYHLGHLPIETPWGNAGGVLKTVEEVELMAHSGVGWLEAGSYTLEKRIGNSPNGEEVYIHDPETGITANSLGMPNKGFDVVEKEIPAMTEAAHKHHKPLIVNVAPVSTNPVPETAELVERALAAGADNVIINASCPNVEMPDGERHVLCNNNAAFKATLNGLRTLTEKYNSKFMVRVAPAKNIGQAGATMLAIRQSGVISVVFDPNTFPIPTGKTHDYLPEAPANTGGLSGSAYDHAAYRQTFWAVRALQNSGINVVSSCGVTNGQELARRKAIGAIAGAGTTLYYESARNGLSWSEATDRLTREYIAAV